jgi:predicted nucleic acid-binding protein
MSLIDEDEDSVYIFPLCQGDFKRVKVLDQGFDKKLVHDEILEALLKFKKSNTDIVDCILAAYSSSDKVVVSFDKDLEKLKAVTETL